MPNTLEVVSYSPAALRSILSRQSSPDVVGKKFRTRYFEEYFGKVNPKTIVIETPYIDRDFLEDFAAYYVRCFSDYKRKCARLHFFNSVVTRKDLHGALDGAESNARALQKGYLGFIVLKPLPQTFIGRTCLVTYPEREGRTFPIVRTYEANLCGIALRVRALAYQEQDRVAAACATSALWSVFHGTGKLFQHYIPSPVEITKAANVAVSHSSRSLPSQGLNPNQMAAAMRAVGLDPFSVNASDEHILKSTVYAYLRGHVPILLGIKLFEKDKSGYVFDGNHAVALTGYRLKKQKAIPSGKTGFLLRAARVDKIYAHDDQVGPYARMQFDGCCVDYKGEKFMSAATSWPDRAGKLDNVRAVPTLMLVPLYHKIRIPFEVIHDLAVRFDSLIELLRPFARAVLPERVEWDIFLTTVNEYKSSLLKSSKPSFLYRRAVLQENMPRFLWRATACLGQDALFDLLFDATDIEQGQLFVRAVEYDPVRCSFFRSVCKSAALRGRFEGKPEIKIIEWFAGQS
jgi:hypothetical protein